MKRYEEIQGGSWEDAENKFPWLGKAKFKNARIDIRDVALIWKDGTWVDGIWEDGTWLGGVMWSNTKARHMKVRQENGKLCEEEDV